MSDVENETCRQRARAGRKTTTRKIADTSDRQFRTVTTWSTPAVNINVMQNAA